MAHRLLCAFKMKSSAVVAIAMLLSSCSAPEHDKGGSTGGTGGSTAGTNGSAGTGGSTAGTGGSTAGTGGSATGGTTGSAGTRGSTAGTGGSATGGTGEIWKPDSVGIDFALLGPTRNQICQFSATRVELTETQIDGLSSLRLQDSMVTAGCDIPTYSITIHAADSSSAHYQATDVRCSSSPIILFDEFDAWAKSTPCSLQR